MEIFISFYHAKFRSALLDQTVICCELILASAALFCFSIRRAGSGVLWIKAEVKMRGYRRCFREKKGLGL